MSIVMHCDLTRRGLVVKNNVFKVQLSGDWGYKIGRPPLCTLVKVVVNLNCGLDAVKH